MKNQKNRNELIFSDLDGTLLDHHDYSFSAALEALSTLKQNAIPLILTTSKTFSEVVELQKEMDILEPCIVENGAGIFIPSSSELASELPFKEEWIKISKAYSYIELRMFFVEMKREFSMRGFGDMSVDEVMERTGLDANGATNAMKRDFSEPFIIEDASLIPLLKSEANKEGLDVLKGGRFYHLVSLHQDKANAMITLTDMYQKYYNTPFTKIALGDSANDFTMLQRADVGVLVPLYDGSFATLDAPRVIRAKEPGPKGWNSFILERYDAK